MKSVFKFLFCIFAMFLILSNYSFSEAALKKEKWVVTLGGDIPACPAIGSDGTIYIGASYTKSLHAINPDGSTKWSFLTGGFVQSSPAIGSDGTIYVG
ncbi:PQQ-binding-like beta-propeller repeat protein, partial [Maridesulfovibrio zosterae]|uniref:PQQ-binding-like beta-propeller repeat protein n=1 Tax=Maridesulfovibrio zosterae TaxID=82171 RepID=UPI00054DADB7